jgi:hypothetical protein
METESIGPIRITLDVSAIMSAIFWSAALVFAVYWLRQTIPALLKKLTGRVSKFDFAGVTLEFSKAKASTPEFSSATAGIDLRQRASAMRERQHGGDISKSTY